ncbi:hypothetical protein [Kitasatospora sp. NPDC059571]|uniref:hypothetical protein n=1 Tax=Kitasatospora sp. NPDC059571 TaxID=3346871 RepID=UPI0036D1BD31
MPNTRSPPQDAASFGVSAPVRGAGRAVFPGAVDPGDPVGAAGVPVAGAGFVGVVAGADGLGDGLAAAVGEVLGDVLGAGVAAKAPVAGASTERASAGAATSVLNHRPERRERDLRVLRPGTDLWCTEPPRKAPSVARLTLRRRVVRMSIR